MSTSILMPKLGMTMKEGTVVEWLKQPGDAVQKGEGVATISSDKLTSEVEAPASGTLLEVLADVDEEVEVGVAIGVIGEAGEKANEVSSAENVKQNVAVAEPEAKADVLVEKQATNQRKRISPAARKKARELGVDTLQVIGTGPKGRITRRDIEKFAKENGTKREQDQVAAAKKEANVENLVAATTMEPNVKNFVVEAKPKTAGRNLSTMRSAIANRMHESITSTAQLTLHRKADINKLLEFKKTIQAEASRKELDLKLTLTVLLARAVTLSLKDMPSMNTHLMDQKLYSYDEVHLGIATALEEGLVVPVVRNAEQLPLGELAKAIRLVTEKARTGRVESNEISGSTFTITNLGSQGIEYFTPILNTPESGILGVGSFMEELKLEDGQVVSVTKLPLSLTFDHRVIDGSPAAEFLGRVIDYLENPYLLVL